MKVLTAIDIDAAYQHFIMSISDLNTDSILTLFKQSVQLDKIGYVKAIFDHIQSSNLMISRLDLNSGFKNYIKSYIISNFSFDRVALFLRIFYYWLECLMKKEDIENLKKPVQFSKFIERTGLSSFDVDFAQLFNTLVEVRRNNSEIHETDLKHFESLFNVIDGYLNSLGQIDVLIRQKSFSYLFLSDKAIVETLLFQLENERYVKM